MSKKEKDLKAAVKVKAITYEGDDIFSLDTNYGTIKAKTINPFNTDEEKEVICTAMPSAITKKQKEAIKLLNWYQWYTKEYDDRNGMDDDEYFLLLECIMGKYQ